MREMPYSNLCWKSKNIDWGFSWFSSVSQPNAGTIHQIGPRLLSSASFPIHLIFVIRCEVAEVDKGTIHEFVINSRWHHNICLLRSQQNCVWRYSQWLRACVNHMYCGFEGSKGRETSRETYNTVVPNFVALWKLNFQWIRIVLLNIFAKRKLNSAADFSEKTP